MQPKQNYRFALFNLISLYIVFGSIWVPLISYTVHCMTVKTFPFSIWCSSCRNITLEISLAFVWYLHMHGVHFQNDHCLHSYVFSFFVFYIVLPYQLISNRFTTPYCQLNAIFESLCKTLLNPMDVKCLWVNYKSKEQEHTFW